MLRLGAEEKMLQELGSGQPAAVAQVNDFGNVPHDIYHLHLLVKLQSLLRIVAEADGLAHIEGAAVRLLQAHQDFDERGFPGAVVADDAHLLVAGEDVREMIQDADIPVCLAEVVRLEYLVADVSGFHLQAHFVIVHALLGHFLQFIESLLAIARLVSTGLRHAAHPLQLRPIEVVGTLYLHTLGIQPLLPLLQVIAVVSFITVYALVVNLQDFRAGTVEEIAVVRHHQQRYRGAAQIVLQPLHHVQVQVIGRLVQDQQLRLGDERIGKGHPLQLASGQLAHRLVEIPDMQAGEDLLHLVLIIPSLVLLHAEEDAVHVRVVGMLHAMLIVAYQVGNWVAVAEACLQHREFLRIAGILLQIPHPEVLAERDGACIIAFPPCQYVQQGGLAAAVFGNQPYTLPLSQAEGNAFKQHQIAERLGQVFYL